MQAVNLISQSEKGSEVRVFNLDLICVLSSIRVILISLAWSITTPFLVRVGGSEVARSQHVIVGVTDVGT